MVGAQGLDVIDRLKSLFSDLSPVSRSATTSSAPQARSSVNHQYCH